MYSCKPKIQGSGKKKSLMLFRTAVTHSTPEWKSFVGLSLGSNPNKPVKLEGNTTMGPRKKTSGSKKETLSKKAANSDGLVVGSKVGAKAAVISSDNVGHKMMRLMGWQPGESLGVNGTGGIVDPIAAVIRGNRKGLGS
jgi:Fe2+ transport system protein FeoA